MDVYVSTVARWPARSRADAHADGSTLVSRKAPISGFATNPTRAFFANALKSDRNHRITFYYQLGMRSSAAISLYAGRISFNAGTHSRCGFGHKVKLAPYWNQQLARMIRSLNESFFGHNMRIF